MSWEKIKIGRKKILKDYNGSTVGFNIGLNFGKRLFTDILSGYKKYLTDRISGFKKFLTDILSGYNGYLTDILS